MDADAVLGIMRGYFTDRHPPEVLAAFEQQSPKALLKESLDVVDFVVYLEEELGREIDINQLGEALLNKNFGELSGEVSRMLVEA